MARGSGGVFGKLLLLGVGAVIGAAMTQKKVDSDGTSTSQASNLKENVKKGLERFNEQSGGMVDKVKPTVNKAVESVKSAIDSQQKMMDKEKDMLDKANQTLQDEVGSTSGGSSTGSSSTSTGTTGTAGGSAGSVGSTTGSSTTGAGSTGATSGSDAIDSTPAGGIYGGSTEYSESLKKNLDKDDPSKSKSSNNSTFDK
ncbi:hypothetical protein QWY16_16985 [Planococcus shenhongbingii]|uniref:YtxH domain-containing protein n=1 Tax=Planococcus shenhongbingii TaxID=3058398 RepID=A0ABT8NB49_9BACL|nr:MULTISPECIES: hypothetical protein [unclassified Planococcus (in: firmicutes)]MDN7245076.1 hypothetical protein [Planococcus sp. N017]WKA58171.1 hypothetical protein QWY16_16985 [Planococcus sp. N016]